MPSATDLLNRGMDMGFLIDIANGKVSRRDRRGQDWHPERREFETLPGEVVLKGPADFDFNWARLTAFVKNSTAAESAAAAGSAKQKSSLWNNSARVIKAASQSGTFPLMALHSMSLESMRDVLFMIAWSPIENKIRIPKKVQNRWANSGASLVQHRGLVRKLGGAFTTPRSPLRASTRSMFQGTDMTKLDPHFESPVDMQRPLNSTVGHSLGQKRLDHLTNNRALPACIMPEGFERGVPIKPDDSFNGIYFNKHTASEQASFVLETGLKLATVPGIAGGRCTTVPDSFKGSHPNPNQERDWQDAQLEEEEQQQRQQQQQKKGGSTAAGPHFDPAVRGARTPLRMRIWSSGPTSRAAASEPDAEVRGSAATPSLPEADAGSDHDSVRTRVAPDSADTGVRPEPGASDRAARASVEPRPRPGAPVRGTSWPCSSRSRRPRRCTTTCTPTSPSTAASSRTSTTRRQRRRWRSCLRSRSGFLEWLTPIP